MPMIEIYTQPWCPYCSRAMRLLAGKGAPMGIDLREIEAPHGSPERAESVRRSGGLTSVPQIFIDGRHVGGCDDLMALDRKGELDGLLQAAA
jgi:glutaredoxin 3